MNPVPRYLPEGKISSKRKHRSTIGMPAGLRPDFRRGLRFGRGGGIDGARLGSASYRPCCRYFKVLNLVVHCTGTRVVSETLPGTARIRLYSSRSTRIAARFEPRFERCCTVEEIRNERCFNRIGSKRQQQQTAAAAAASSNFR